MAGLPSEIEGYLYVPKPDTCRKREVIRSNSREQRRETKSTKKSCHTPRDRYSTRPDSTVEFCEFNLIRFLSHPATIKSYKSLTISLSKKLTVVL